MWPGSHNIYISLRVYIWTISPSTLFSIIKGSVFLHCLYTHEYYAGDWSDSCSDYVLDATQGYKDNN